MSLEIEEESPQEVVPLHEPSGTGGAFADRAATAEGEAASGSWAIGDPFADDALHDDGNRLFPAEDREPSRDVAPTSEGPPRPRGPRGEGPDVLDVETKGIASPIGQTRKARDDDERLRIGRG